MPLDDLLSRLAQNLLHPKVVVEDKVADDAVLATAAPAASLSRTTAAAHLLILLGRALLLRTALRGGGRRRVLRLAAEHQHEGHQVEGLAGRHCRAASAAVAVANQIKADRLVFAPGEADAEAGLLLLHQAAVVELQNARVEGCTGTERVQERKVREWRF